MRSPAVPTPQTGIFALGTMSHVYLEFELEAGVDGANLVALVASLREPRTTIGGVNLVAGFRPELWARVAPDAAPPGVGGFATDIVGEGGYTMPATSATSSSGSPGARTTRSSTCRAASSTPSPVTPGWPTRWSAGHTTTTWT
jgi:hypothetical protein